MARVPFLYSKLLGMIRQASEDGKHTSIDRINFDMGRKFRLSKTDIKECLKDLQSFKKIQFDKPYNHTVLLRD